MKKKSSISQKIVKKIMIGCAPTVVFFFIFIILVSTMSMYFSSASMSDKISQEENAEIVDLAKKKSEDISAEFRDYYGTDKRFALGYNYILAYSKYHIVNEEYKNSYNYSSKEELSSVIDSAASKLKPIISYKEDKIITTREYKVNVKYFDTTGSLPKGISIVEKAPEKTSLVEDITYCIDDDETYYKKEDGSVSLSKGKPKEVNNISFYAKKIEKMVADDYDIGKKIFILEDVKLYEVIEKEETKKEVKEENIFLVITSKTIGASYALEYEVKTDVKEKDGEKITIVKPVITSMKQTDKKWDYLKSIITSNYPTEDAGKALEIILASALSYVKEAVTEDMIFAGNGGSISPEDFNGSDLEFIEKVAPGAIKAYEMHGILPSITIAQAILESDRGKSGLTQMANNLFGIKAFGWPGQTIDMLTKEYDEAGSELYVLATFRAYDSWDDSIEDHSKVLLQPNFTGVIAAKTYQEAAEALRAGGYATDPIYPQLLINLIETYSIYQYDK